MGLCVALCAVFFAGHIGAGGVAAFDRAAACNRRFVCFADDRCYAERDEAPCFGFIHLADAAALNELSEVCGTEAKVTAEQLSRFPDVLTVTKADEDLETVSADLCVVTEQALEAYNAMRAVEGRKLAEDIGNRLCYIEDYTSQVEKRSPETVAEYRAKLTARMEEVLQSTTIDPQRILQEAAIYADKVAVDEETVRLRSHVAQLRTMLESDEPMGRKMDFLIQEVNRESNTIGSKCCDVAIAQVVVGLKAEVEKMREQVQNVE